MGVTLAGVYCFKRQVGYLGSSCMKLGVIENPSMDLNPGAQVQFLLRSSFEILR